MNTFFCQKCDERLFFENTVCLSCNSALGFLPDLLTMSVIEAQPNAAGSWVGVASAPNRRLYRKCANYAVENACNWMIPIEEPDAFCKACRLNQTIPDLSGGNNREMWVKMEAAKRRLIYSLLKLKLTVIPKTADPQRGMAFQFLADPAPQFAEGDRVLTGHADGVITINLAEADDAVRESMRLNMREVYRTLLGHFRHECGHYYWNLLVRFHPNIDAVRKMFGDERIDYQTALQKHYQMGPPPSWGATYVTPYAAAHPWEDWAETWAHYLHIMDTLETAAAGGLEIHGRKEQRAIANPYELDFPSIREHWHALRFVINSLNRSMGMADPYPFILSDAITEKLAFIHHWVSDAAKKIEKPNSPVGTVNAISSPVVAN
jgi:hypothetical protein